MRALGHLCPLPAYRTRRWGVGKSAVLIPNLLHPKSQRPNMARIITHIHA
jgi:hypothetical protein